MNQVTVLMAALVLAASAAMVGSLLGQWYDRLRRERFAIRLAMGPYRGHRFTRAAIESVLDLSMSYAHMRGLADRAVVIFERDR